MVMVIVVGFIFFNEITAISQIYEPIHYLFGDATQNLKLEEINDNDVYLIVPSTNVLSLVNQETFMVEKSIDIPGGIDDYLIIDNIESEQKANRDIIIFTKDESLPSVVVYSLDTLEPIWSFTSTYSGYTDTGIKITNKLSVLDYDVNEETLLIVAGYKLYNLNLIDGSLKWTYTHQNNIWSVCTINDITNDGINDLVISTQPTDVISIDGELGNKVWQKSVAKDYEVTKDKKVIDKVKRNVWDLHFNNNKIIATSEDGYLYQIDPINGIIEKEVEMNTKIPNLLVTNVYLQNNLAIAYSGLGVNGISTYKIMNTRLIQDITDDGLDDLLVTIYEDNPYASYQYFNSKLVLLDGNSLSILSEKELILNRPIIDLNINDFNQLSFYNLNDMNVIDLNEVNLNSITEIEFLSEEDDALDIFKASLLNENTLYLITDALYQLNITNPSNPLLENTLHLISDYDTILGENSLFKLYYKKNPSEHHKNNYFVIQNVDIGSKEINWEYAIEDIAFSNLSGINDYVIMNSDDDEDDEFFYINNKGELVKLDYGSELVISIASNEFNTDAFEWMHFSTYRDINDDGINELMLISRQGDFILINGANINEILQHKYLNKNQHYDETTLAEKMYDMAFPTFNEEEHIVYLVNNNSINKVTFNPFFEIINEEETLFGKYSFWYDQNNLFCQTDYDNDGINDYVLRLNSSNVEDKQIVAILYSGTGHIGYIKTGWDFSLYPTNEDLDEDGIFDIILVTSGEDDNGIWYQLASLLSPSLQMNVNETTIFKRLFYDGNDFSMNSKYKPIQIINDINGDGKKNIAVLIDRWQQSYIQIYDVDNPSKVLKVIPLQIDNIDEADMLDSQIGAPGGIIDIIYDNEKEYLLLSTLNGNQSITTRLYEMTQGNLEHIEALVLMNHSVYQYRIVDQVFVATTFNDRNRTNNRLHLIDLNTRSLLQNIKEGDVFTEPNLSLNWFTIEDELSELDLLSSIYKVYLNGNLVTVTDELTAELILINGKNTIGIGTMLADGNEVITNVTIMVNIVESNTTPIYFYFSVLLLVVFITPLKFRNYKRKVFKNE